jgi:hypothetical protein
MIDIANFVSTIFTKPAQSKNSIYIELDMNNPNAEGIFEFLIDTLVQGIKILFQTDSFQLEDITNSNIQVIQEYYNSFGFIVKISVKPMNIMDSKVDDIFDDELPDLTDNNKKLSDYYFSITNRNTNVRISFDYLL